jgi:hypothetical protein
LFQGRDFPDADYEQPDSSGVDKEAIISFFPVFLKQEGIENIYFIIHILRIHGTGIA